MGLNISDRHEDVFKYLKASSIIFLFAWVSYFAPLIGGRWRTVFLAVISFISVFIIIAERHSYKLIFGRDTIPLWVFLAAMAGSLIDTANPPMARQHFWAFIFPAPFIFFFLKIMFEENCGIVIARGLCLMAASVSIFGIIEFVTGQNFIYRDFFNTFCYDAFRGERMMSLHVHPAPLGTYLAAILPVAYVLFLKERKLIFRSLTAFYILLIFISIVLTFSRGVLFGMLLSMYIVFVVLGRLRRPFFILLLILLSIAALIMISSLLDSRGYHQFYRFSARGLSLRPLYARKMDRIIAAASILKDHPFLGLGLGHYRLFFDHYLPHLSNITSPLSKVADNMYITILTETGLVGFSGFILFICSLLRQAWMKMKSIQLYEDGLWLLCFLAGFAGIMGSFLTYDGLWWDAPAYLFWGYAGILSSLSTNKLE